MKYKLCRWQCNSCGRKIIWLASISNGLVMELEVKFSSRLERILSLKIVWQCHVGELILENLVKDQCYVFAPYGRLMYPL